MAQEEQLEREVLSERLQRVELRMEAVLEINRTLSSTRDPDKLLSLIMEKITELMYADRSTLFLVNRKEGVIWSKVLQGEDVIPIRLPLGTGIAGWVAQTGEVLNLQNAYEDERFNPKIDQQTGYVTSSILTMPLQNQRKRIIGVVQVLNKNGGEPFIEEDELLLQALTAQAAIFLENAQLYHTLWQKNIALLNTSEQLRQRTHELDILYEIERETSRAFDLDGILSGILTRLTELMNCEASSIALADRKSRQLYFHCATGSQAESIRRLRLNENEGIIGWCVTNNEAVVSNNPEEDDRFSKKTATDIDFPVESVICVPLNSNEKTLGALQLLNKQDGQGFHTEDLKLLRMIAAQISQAIEIGHQRDEQFKQNHLATIGRLLSGLLHDLKTPMTLVSGYAQMLTFQEDPEKRESFAKEIQKQVERLNKMTREVLSFAKGESTMLVRKVHMNQFTPEIESDLNEEFASSSVELKVISNYRGPANFDETKIQRLIFNMARNARQAMPNGGKFLVTFDSDKTNLLITFEDTGIGIPLELQDQIFDSFVTGRPSEGTGLGLAIVKKIVDEHHGEISFKSIPKQGTTFHVTLPLVFQEKKVS